MKIEIQVERLYSGADAVETDTEMRQDADSIETSSNICTQVEKPINMIPNMSIDTWALSV